MKENTDIIRKATNNDFPMEISLSIQLYVNTYILQRPGVDMQSDREQGGHWTRLTPKAEPPTMQTETPAVPPRHPQQAQDPPRHNHITPPVH